MRKENNVSGENPQLKFINIGRKMKQDENTIGLDDLFKRFFRNRKSKPVTNEDILKTLLENQRLIPKSLHKTPVTLLVLNKRKPQDKKVRKEYKESIAALTFKNNQWIPTELYPVEYYTAEDYVICSRN
jgi:hypothetical protein